MMKTIFLFTLLFSLFASCSNKHTSESNIQEQVITNINPLEEAFKEIKILKDSCDKILLTDTKVWSVLNDQVYNFIQKDVVKNRIIQEKSRTYFDKLALLGSERITMKVEVKYENGIYKYLIHTHEGIIPISAELTYDSQYDKLTVNWVDNGRIVQSDGEVHYNTEGWELHYAQDDFGEDIKTEPVATYALITTFSGAPGIELGVYIAKVPYLCMILFTEKLDWEDMSADSKISKILIKDHNSDKVYNITFDDYYYKSGASFYDYIGVFLHGEKLWNFVDIIAPLKNYTISLIDEDHKRLNIKNPENLCNMRDAVEKILINNEK